MNSSGLLNDRLAEVGNGCVKFAADIRQQARDLGLQRG
jgi:hypothetical protein